ncbi:MAG: RNA methyltransferase [Candidatus Hodarchaeota archaeon]
MNKKDLRLAINFFQETHVSEQYANLSFTIVLVRPEHSANIGSVARIMQNFDFQDLIIFNPKESEEKILSYETQGFAMHGKEILFNAKIISFDDQEEHISKFKESMEQFDLIIATTAKGKHYRNIRRTPIFPEDLKLPVSQKPIKIAILFGKESRGLTNDEIEIADLLLRIPTGKSYPSLNLSHACGIILYEIFKKMNSITLGRGVNPVILANKKDRLILYSIIKNLIKKLKIRTHKKENVFFAFKNIYERALITKKELSLIIGVFSKLESIISNLNLYRK